MKPKSIKLFDLLFLGSIVVSVIGLALNWGALSGVADAAVAEAGLSDGGGTFARIAIIAAALFFTLLYLAVWFLISVLRIEVVKWVLVALAAWTLISLPFDVAEMGGFSALMLPGIISAFLMVAAIPFLFRADAKAWFAEKRGTRTN